MKPSLVVGAVLGLLAFSSGASAATIALQARLTGTQEVPANASGAIGNAVLLEYDDVARIVTGSVDCSLGARAVTSAHLHLGACGVNGAPFVTMTGSSCGVGNGIEIPPATILSVAEGNALLTGGVYINLHTTAFPNGEIRGQIFLKPDAGGNVCPAPVADAGTEAGVDAAVPPAVDAGSSGSSGTSGTSGTPRPGVDAGPPATGGGGDDSGCSTSGGDAGGLAGVAAVLLALVVARRRRQLRA